MSVRGIDCLPFAEHFTLESSQKKLRPLLPKIAYLVHELSLPVPYKIRRLVFKLCRRDSLLTSPKLKLPFKVKRLIFKLFPDKLYIRDISENISLRLDIKSRDESYIYTNGYWEKNVTALIRQICKTGDVVFDVGANIGYYTLITADLVGAEGRVYAFEPCPRNIHILESNVRQNHFGNISIETTALGEKPETTHMYFPDNVQFGSGGFFKDRRYLVRQEVQVTTLDDFIKQRGITRIDFLKMDIEGGEVFALRGMKEALRQKIITYAFIDIHNTILSHSGYKPQEIKKCLADYGYTLHRVVGDQYVPTCVDSEEGGYFLASVSKALNDILKK